MFKAAAAVALALFASAAAAADCPSAASAPEKAICADAALSALDAEVSRLAGLAGAGARKGDLARSQASFRRTLAACRTSRPCLQRTLVEQIFHLRQVYAGARSQDASGISLGPVLASCPGLEAPVSVTYVNGDPALAFLAWRYRAVVLQQAEAASGARYAGPYGPGEARFWTKGKEATLELPGEPKMTCEMREGG